MQAAPLVAVLLTVLAAAWLVWRLVAGEIAGKVSEAESVPDGASGTGTGTPAAVELERARAAVRAARVAIHASTVDPVDDPIAALTLPGAFAGAQLALAEICLATAGRETPRLWEGLQSADEGLETADALDEPRRLGLERVRARLLAALAELTSDSGLRHQAAASFARALALGVAAADPTGYAADRLALAELVDRAEREGRHPAGVAGAVEHARAGLAAAERTGDATLAHRARATLAGLLLARAEAEPSIETAAAVAQVLDSGPIEAADAVPLRARLAGVCAQAATDLSACRAALVELRNGLRTRPDDIPLALAAARLLTRIGTAERDTGALDEACERLADVRTRLGPESSAARPIGAEIGRIRLALATLTPDAAPATAAASELRSAVARLGPGIASVAGAELVADQARAAALVARRRANAETGTPAAVGAFRRALRLLRRERAPIAWSMWMSELGEALLEAGGRNSAPALLREAARAFRRSADSSGARAPAERARALDALAQALIAEAAIARREPSAEATRALSEAYDTFVALQLAEPARRARERLDRLEAARPA